MKITLSLFDNPTPLSFDAPSRGTPANMHIYLIFLETRIIDLFLPLIVWVYLHSILCSGLRKTIFPARVRFGHSRSSKVIDFGTNRKCVCDFLLVRHSNLGVILYRFGDIAGFVLMTPPPIPHQFWGCSRCMHQIAHVGVSPSINLKLISRKIISKYSNLCERYGRTDHGQTDRRHTVP